MGTLATILFTLAVVSVLSWVLLKVRKGVGSVDSADALAAPEKKGRDWSVIAMGVLFAAFGLDAALRGEAEVDIAHVSGANVRVAGALLCAIGIALASRSLKRNEHRANQPTEPTAKAAAHR